VAGTLKKPRQSVFRSFLYLDGDRVINSLSALEGGDIDEVLTRVGEDGGGELGGELGVSGAKLKGSRRKGRKFEEEVRRKRTEHSAATTLLKTLHEQEAIGLIQGPYGQEIHSELEDHMLLEFQASIRIHPLHQVITAARGWLKLAPEFGAGKDDVREMAQTVKLMETIAQPGAGERTFLVFAETTGTVNGYKLILPINERHLLVPLDDFTGSATFVAQVDRVLREDDEVLAVRLIRNAPQLALEREGLAEALPELIFGIGELGIETAEEDFFLRAPGVILKPICIYK
jgi:hypothetical protein